jgi:molybdenum cofactor guanylyltransferase
MGGADKGLLPFRGLSLIQHVIGRLSSQVDTLIINANQNLGEYAKFNLPVYSDEIADYAGPLAGLQAGLRHCQTPYLLTSPCDSPLLPMNLAERMLDELRDNSADLAVAATGTMESLQLHPVFCLLKTELLPQLTSYLQSGGRKVREWQASQNMTQVCFPDENAFRNLNTLEELRTLE